MSKKVWLAAAGVAAVSAVAACGGGSSGNTFRPVPVATSGVMSGIVVDDASGVPLAGVPVRVDPWVSFPTPGPTPTPLLTTTTGTDGRFAISLAFGTYLLVIGDDAVGTPPAGFATPAPGIADTHRCRDSRRGARRCTTGYCSSAKNN